MGIPTQVLDQRWFEHIFTVYEKEIRDRKLTKRKPIFFDLTNYYFISFYDLLNLFLTVDYFQDFIGDVTIKFYGFGIDSEYKIIPLEDFYKIRKDEFGEDKSSFQQTLDYKYSKNTYNFLSYLEHFEFFSSLNLARKKGTVIIPGISDKLLSNLHPYSGVGGEILNLTPIVDVNVAKFLRLESSVDTFINKLPKNVHQHPLFRDREFINVLGYQIAYNMFEHSGFQSFNKIGVMGAISMQFIGKEKFTSNFVETNYNVGKHLFNLKYDGVVELCLGDKGIGIYNSLKKSFSEVFERIGEKKENFNLELLEEVVTFAFDEIGTSKIKKEHIGGVHALHRVLKTVAKYGGLLAVRTNGIELFYDLAKNKLNRMSSGLGFKSTFKRKIFHPNGVQFQILIPISIESTKSQKIPPRFSKNLLFTDTLFRTKYKNIIIPLATYFDKRTLIEDYSTIKSMLEFVYSTSDLYKEAENVIIVYDFTGRNWTEEEVALILHAQEGILNSKFCIGINFPKGLPKNLRERERAKIHNEYAEEANFFDILSSKHRLFPAFDTNDELTWLGLSDYNFDPIFMNGYYMKTILLRRIR